VLGECLADGLFEVGNIGHRGVQRPQMGQRLATHRLFHQRELGELLAAQAGRDPIDLVAMLRRRPPRTSAARNELRRGVLTAVGVGAIARVARASELARSSKVARKVG
jgi:hypothetical protein